MPTLTLLRGLLSRRAGVALAAAVAALGVVSPAAADAGHANHGGGAVAAFTSAPVLWGFFALGILVVVLMVTRSALAAQMAGPGGRAGGGESMFKAVGQFSRNAKLFLSYSLLSELGTGIWSVLFNLYLLRQDFTIEFIGMFWLVNMLCHGAASLPVGVLADRYGRRQAFFGATFLSILAQGGVLLTGNPSAILVLGGIAGMGQAAHGVAGSPFMMENSEQRERPHLFSLNAGLLQMSRFGGSMAGGLVPLAWAAGLGIPNIDPAAVKAALITGLPLTVMATLPILFIRERPVENPASLSDLVTLRNVVNFNIVAKLTLVSLIFGTAFGLTIRFFNVFFQDVHYAGDGQIGAILAIGSLAGVSTIFLSPVISQRYGKAQGILITQALSVPFLLLMAMVPSLTFVTILFMTRGAVYSIAMPMREQLSMEFISAKERGTTAGFTHTAFDFGGGVGAGLAGGLIAGGGYIFTFSMAGALILVPAVLYYVFFANLEAGKRAGVMAEAQAVAGGGGG